MIVVTGGAGFIGSNVARRLVERGEDVLVVDRLDPRKATNLLDVAVSDYVDRDDFLDLVRRRSGVLGDVAAVIHQGACSSTTEPDSQLVMRLNHAYSKELVDWCLEASVPLVYASSAAVYGAAAAFAEEPENEHPANVYGWSKLLVDRYVRARLGAASSQLVGLRYFNVYGPGEHHKDEMASIVLQLADEVARAATATIFGASHGLGPGEQRRDFVSVHDVVDVVLWFLDHPDRSGLFNVGTGASRTFRDVADAVVAHRGGEVRFRDFPPELADRYQPHTCADLGKLRAAGYEGRFTAIEEGIADYLAALDR